MSLDRAPALVLLHGFTNTGASWEPVLVRVGQRYRALAPDIRGQGAASSAAPVTLEAVIADVAELAPERFTLCGYSMGGRIALHVALALPDRVQRVVTIGASPGLADPVERTARRAADEQLAQRIERITIEAFADEWADAPLLAGAAPEVAARARADRLRNSPAGLAAALRGLGTGALPSLWERLGELRAPVTLVAGERDTKFRQLARQMAARLPHAEVVIVGGAGHAVHLEHPDKVARILEERLGFGHRGTADGDPARP